MTTLPPVGAVLFDYGCVISVDQPAAAVAEIERLAGVEPAALWSAYWGERLAYDAGAYTADGFWSRLAKLTGADWPAARRQQLWAADVASWSHIDPEAVELIEELAADGVRLALLSNAPHDMAALLRSSPVAERFERLFFSCDLGLTKPDPAIYRHVLAELAVEPSELVFADDRAENVAAAAALGIRAHHHAGVAGLRAALGR
ncbi:HAD family hydrolase [Allonocardiopsis opalescens]|uniref:Putative hydrolase of the HAD superfamily n=1 Tax=Allonocardiopsis opalescens TaxID=1144618 RepID=A0A2T0PXC8_9ACTN|nr:HAD family phosphatase [Allonocardiopsis opalescens]PRX96193.1 putative hydrolase of the HAD superfamily [Allonocardiopsis opalescens]